MPSVAESYYDALHRLDYAQRNGVTNLDLAYDALGNITSKSDVGTYTYHATKKHAVTAAGSYTFAYDGNGNQTARNGQAVSGYSYNLPNVIDGAAGYSSEFFYGPHRNRWKQEADYGGTSETTIYVGGLLEKVTLGSVTSWKHAIAGGAGVAAVYTRKSNGTNEIHYLSKDHLGSVDTVTSGTGAVEVRLSFGAFGQRRNAAGWSGNPTSGDWAQITATTRHGFTAHEMLDNLALIHMNGRVYDPVVGRFLSVDPLLQGAGFTQSFNRFSYVLNNPLRFTDPSGLACQQYNPGGGGLGTFQVCSDDTLLHWFFHLLHQAGAATNYNTVGSGVGVSAGEQETATDNEKSVAPQESQCTLGDLASDIWNGIKEGTFYRHVVQFDFSVELIWGSASDGFNRWAVYGGGNSLLQGVLTFEEGENMSGHGAIFAVGFGRNLSYSHGPAASGHFVLQYTQGVAAFGPYGVSGSVSHSAGSIGGSVDANLRGRGGIANSMGFGLAGFQGKVNQYVGASPALIGPPKYSGKCNGVVPSIG